MSDEKAKAAQAIAKLGTVAIETAYKVGSFLSRVFGTVPDDIVGICIGDWLHHVRIRNLARLADRTEEILKKRGIEHKTEPVSPSLALPLLAAAQDETRDELRELWARLLANAMDPARSNAVRQSIITALKAFDPPDAIFLLEATRDPGRQVRQAMLETLPAFSKSDFEVSARNLERLGCLFIGRLMQDREIAVVDRFQITYFGLELLRAVEE